MSRRGRKQEGQVFFSSFFFLNRNFELNYSVEIRTVEGTKLVNPSADTSTISVNVLGLDGRVATRRCVFDNAPVPQTLFISLKISPSNFLITVKGILIGETFDARKV